MLKTIAVSKIKEVKSVSDPYGKYQTLYHKLIMENGDKIDIGKQKEQQVGWEMTYEITEEGQGEFNKAKAVAPEGFKNNGAVSGSPNGKPTKEYWENREKKNKEYYAGRHDNKQLNICRQSSLKSAVDSCKGENHHHILKVAQIYVDWVMEDKMPDENDARPF
jgi:hypothetical protein